MHGLSATCDFIVIKHELSSGFFFAYQEIFFVVLLLLVIAFGDI